MIPADVQQAITQLFASSSSDPSLYSVILRGAKESVEVVRELYKKETRGRLFLHVHTTVGNRGSAPETLRDILDILRRTCALSKSTSQQMSNDVGVRPLVAVLARTKSFPSPALLDASAISCELLRLVVLHNPKAGGLLRLDSGLDAIHGVLAPLPLSSPALVLHGTSLLMCVCGGARLVNEPNVRWLQRKGFVSVLADALSSMIPRGGEPLAPEGLSISHLLAALLSVQPTTFPEVDGGSPPALVSLSLKLLGASRRELVLCGLTVLGAVAGSTPKDTLFSLLFETNAIAGINNALVAQGLPSDLVRISCSAMGRIAGVFMPSLHDAQAQASAARPTLSLPSGYSSTCLESGCIGTTVSAAMPSGHTALLSPGSSLFLETDLYLSRAVLYPFDVEPPCPLSLWPLPPQYPYWYPKGLASVVEALPPWSAPYLPRAGFYAGASGITGNIVSSTSIPSPPDSLLDLFSVARCWLESPHWFPELQAAAGLLAEVVSEDLARSAMVKTIAKSTNESDVQSLSILFQQFEASPVFYTGSKNGEKNKSFTWASHIHPAAQIGATKNFSVPKLGALASLSTASQAALLALSPLYETLLNNGVAHPPPPCITGDSSTAVQSLRTSLLLLGGSGEFRDESLTALLIPRVWITPQGVRSVKHTQVLAPSTIPHVHHGAKYPRALFRPERSHSVQSAVASPLCSFSSLQRTGYNISSSLDAIGGTDDGVLVDLIEPLFPLPSSLHDALVTSTMLRQTARSLAIAEFFAKQQKSGILERKKEHNSSFFRHLVYFRHASNHMHMQESPSPASLILPGGVALQHSQHSLSKNVCGGVGQASLPLPPISLGGFGLNTPTSSTLLRKSAVLPLAELLDTLPCSELSSSEYPQLSPRSVYLLDDGAKQEDGGESGDEESKEPLHLKESPELSFDEGNQGLPGGGGSSGASVVDQGMRSRTASLESVPGSLDGDMSPSVPTSFLPSANLNREWVPTDDSPPPLPLTFESRFECGNLSSALRVGPREYELSLEPDINTGGHVQWFFFRAQGMQGGEEYTFQIVNMDGGGSVFLAGQRPWVYFEEKDNGGPTPSFTMPEVGCEHIPTLPGIGWRRAGERVLYHKNTYKKFKVGVTPPVWSGENGREGTPFVLSEKNGGGSTRYTHSWRITFPKKCSAAWFAYSLPYSYSDLIKDVRRWEDRALRVGKGGFVGVREEMVGCDLEEGQKADTSSIPAALSFLGYTGSSSQPLPPSHTSYSTPSFPGSLFSSAILHRSVLCNSLAGNPLPLLTITQFSDGPLAVAQRPYVVLSSRVHPGESNASWAMRGFLDLITSSSPLAVALRQKVIFKVVPMLNPDGVINGSHRTNLAGLDLNRYWSSPSINTAPTIWHMRALIMSLQTRAAALTVAASRPPYSFNADSKSSASAAAEGGSGSDGPVALSFLPPCPQPVLLYVDFHGHSRRRNTFTFGCCDLSPATEPPIPGVLHPGSLDKGGANAGEKYSNLAGHLFPKLLAARCETFLYSSCDWGVCREKLSTARASMWRDALLPSALTLEIGFSGPSAGPREGVHNGACALMDIGLSFGVALHDFLDGPTGERNVAAASAIASHGTPSPIPGGGGTNPSDEVKVTLSLKGSKGKGKKQEPREAAILIFSGSNKVASKKEAI